VFEQQSGIENHTIFVFVLLLAYLLWQVSKLIIPRVIANLNPVPTNLELLKEAQDLCIVEFPKQWDMGNLALEVWGKPSIRYSPHRIGEKTDDSERLLITAPFHTIRLAVWLTEHDQPISIMRQDIGPNSDGSGYRTQPSADENRLISVIVANLVSKSLRHN
jgi:hypothetical protein